MVSLFSLFILSCEKVNPEMELIVDSDGEYETSQLKSVQINSSDEINYLLDLIATIESMVDKGLLNKGKGNALIVKIENAIKFLSNLNISTVSLKGSASVTEVATRGGNANTHAAKGLLKAFINQVNSLINKGDLAIEEGQLLINKAENVIILLEGDSFLKINDIEYSLSDGVQQGNFNEFILLSPGNNINWDTWEPDGAGAIVSFYIINTTGEFVNGTYSVTSGEEFLVEDCDNDTNGDGIINEDDCVMRIRDGEYFISSHSYYNGDADLSLEWDEFEIQSGTVIINMEENHLTIDFDCIGKNNDIITGFYSGILRSFPI